MELKKSLTIFSVSSFVSFITLGYLGFAFVDKKCPPGVPYKLFILIIPLLYGIGGIINYQVVEKMGMRYSFIVGAIFGLLLSLVGRFKLHLPTLIFNYTKKTEYMVHMYAAFLYAIIFQLIITPLTTYIVN
jgi:hypothetical protein